MNTEGDIIDSDRNSRRFRLGQGWGWNKFVEQDVLFNYINQYSLDDKLIIVCEITVKIGKNKNISGAAQ